MSYVKFLGPAGWVGIVPEDPGKKRAWADDVVQIAQNSVDRLVLQRQAFTEFNAVVNA